MNLSDATAVYIGSQAASAVYITDAAGTATKVWPTGAPPLPVVAITGTSGTVSRDQFRAACIAHGTTYQTVATLPFQLDTSAATNLEEMFSGCANLTAVPAINTANVVHTWGMFMSCAKLLSVGDLATGQVTVADYMFFGCTKLTDGAVRLIGKHPSVTTQGMTTSSGLTRPPFFDAAGNPI